jgi:hypothetical protein
LTDGHDLAQVAILATLGGEGSMASNYSFDQFLAQSITSVPEGWRVLYVNPNDGTVEAIRPMVGWATWKVSVVDGDGETLQEVEILEAMVIEGGWAVCALEPSPNVVDYLAPGVPDPEIGAGDERRVRAERRGPRANR